MTVTFPSEIPFFLFSFSLILLEPISTNLYIYRTCYVLLGFNKSDCAQLGDKENELTKTLETLVQPTVNHIEMVLCFCQAAIPVVLCMFVGTWSDKFGRKPFLIMALTGLTLSTFLSAIFAHFENISPWYFVLSAIPSMFTGGYNTAFIVVVMYVADTTTSENRVFRMGLFEAVNSSASLIASLSSSYLFYATSYEVVFGIATVLIGISVVYTILLLPESLKVENKVPTLTELVSMMNFSQITKSAFKKRENNERKYIITILGIIAGYNFVFKGDLAVRTLFLREKLQWTLTKVTLVTSYGYIIYISGGIFGAGVLYKKLKFKETHFVVLSLITQGLASLLRALATNDYYIYAGYTISCFGGLNCSMLRTLLTYLVESNELGKIYTISTGIDTLVGIVAGALIYPLLYNVTITTDSGLFNYLDLGIYFVMLMVLLNLMRNDLPNSRTPVLGNEKMSVSEINQ